MSDIVLHGYWRSSAAYRLRIALNLKGVAYRQVAHDLRHGEQSLAEYQAIAPHRLVPAIEVDGRALIETPAILEWIEARWPDPALLPVEPFAAATVRAMGAIVACDTHPLQNLRVLQRLRSMGHGQEAVDDWARHWIGEGFAALERLVERHGGTFAFGDSPTQVDCYLVPQVYNAERFGLDLTPFPALLAAATAARALPAFAAAEPEAQSDAP